MRWPNGSQSRPTVTSNFGPRGPGVGSTIHRGTDFVGIGQVRAIAAGTVKVVGTPSGWSGGGRQVWIQHGGFFVRAMHLGGYAVSNGQHVDEGQIIGSQDTTGTATGSHLHLEVTLGNVHFSNQGQINPVTFISQYITGSPATGGDSDTAQLQLDLNTLGYPLDVDGQSGPATKAAVTQFQKDNKLTADGQAGPATKAEIVVEVKKLQTDLNKLGYTLTTDGKSGPQTVGAVKDFQGKNGLTKDGCVGPATRAKLDEKLAKDVGYNAIPLERPTADVQRLVGATPDGIWGPNTTVRVKAWQLSKKLTPDGIWGPTSDAIGFPKTTAAFIPIDVDGQWGKSTTTALQANLGFTGADITGTMDKATVIALQKAVGAAADGEMGPSTVKHLQSSLGVHIDGQNGPATTTALQTLLNRSGKLIPVPFTDAEPPKKQPKPATPTYPDATRWEHSINSSPREGKVQLLILHHNGTDPIPTADQSWARFNTLNDRSVSPTWQVNSDGTAYEIVPPDAWRAWTTGEIDHQAVTIETQNETVGPQWGISQAAIHRIAKILAFAAKRYTFPIQMGEVSTGNVVVKPGLIGHNMTPAGRSTDTICPGPSMQAAYAQILREATEINNPTSPVEPPVEPPDTEPITIPYQDYEAMLAAWVEFSASHDSENEAFDVLESRMEKLP